MAVTVTARRFAGASPPVDRSALVYGVSNYVPTVAGDTVGVPAGASLTPVAAASVLPTSTGNVSPSPSGFWNITTPDTVVDLVDVYGCIKVSTTGVTIKRSRLRGRPSNAGAPLGTYLPIVDASSSAVGAGGFIVEDCTIWADSPGWQQYGIKGKAKVYAYRNHIGNVTDAFQMYEGGLDARGNLIESLYRVADPNQADGFTHNDGLQYQGGGGAVTLIGNHFNITVTPWTLRSLLCVLLTSDVGTPASTVLIDDNRFEGGSIPINAATTPSTSFSLTDNQIRLGQRDYGSSLFYHVIATTTTQGMWTQTGNTDYPGGGAIVIANG